jgi:hypothetical protein
MINRHKDAKRMTTEQSVGAASDTSVHWREIDWRSVNKECASAPGAYREGSGSGQMGQGESLATAAHKLAEWQVVVRSASDGECGQKDLWRGQRKLGNAREEDGGGR